MSNLEHITPSLRGLAEPIETLQPDPENVRLHGTRNLATIVASLRKFGQQKPVVARPDGVIVAGSGTFAAAIELGWTHLAVSRTNLVGEDATAYAIADNKTAELAEWDREALARQLESLRDKDADLAFATGHTLDEVAALISEANGRPELPSDAAGKTYDESVADEVKTIDCPHCGKAVPV